MIERLCTGTVRLLRAASLLACLIVVLSFVLFAVDQTGSASAHQQAALGGSSPPVAAAHDSKGSVRTTIDDASNKITAPFGGLVSSSNEWVVHGGQTLLVLAVFGFGLGFAARLFRLNR